MSNYKTYRTFRVDKEQGENPTTLTLESLQVQFSVVFDLSPRAVHCIPPAMEKLAVGYGDVEWKESLIQYTSRSTNIQYLCVTVLQV